MCIHPRCNQPGHYILEKTKWGESVMLCEYHGPFYHKEGGGTLKLSATGKEVVRSRRTESKEDEDGSEES